MRSSSCSRNGLVKYGDIRKEKEIEDRLKKLGLWHVKTYHEKSIEDLLEKKFYQNDPLSRVIKDISKDKNNYTISSQINDENSEHRQRDRMKRRRRGRNNKTLSSDGMTNGVHNITEKKTLNEKNKEQNKKMIMNEISGVVKTHVIKDDHNEPLIYRLEVGMHEFSHCVVHYIENGVVYIRGSTADTNNDNQQDNIENKRICIKPQINQRIDSNLNDNVLHKEISIELPAKVNGSEIEVTCEQRNKMCQCSFGEDCVIVNIEAPFKNASKLQVQKYKEKKKLQKNTHFDKQNPKNTKLESTKSHYKPLIEINEQQTNTAQLHHQITKQKEHCPFQVTFHQPISTNNSKLINNKPSKGIPHDKNVKSNKTVQDLVDTTPGTNDKQETYTNSHNGITNNKTNSTDISQNNRIIGNHKKNNTANKNDFDKLKRLFEYHEAEDGIGSVEMFKGEKQIDSEYAKNINEIHRSTKNNAIGGKYNEDLSSDDEAVYRVIDSNNNHYKIGSKSKETVKKDLFNVELTLNKTYHNHTHNGLTNSEHLIDKDINIMCERYNHNDEIDDFNEIIEKNIKINECANIFSADCNKLDQKKSNSVKRCKNPSKSLQNQRCKSLPRVLPSQYKDAQQDNLSNFFVQDFEACNENNSKTLDSNIILNNHNQLVFPAISNLHDKLSVDVKKHIENDLIALGAERSSMVVEELEDLLESLEETCL